MNPAALSVSPDELALVGAILRRHVPQRMVWAFGSRVSGRARKFSDLDLAILGRDPAPLLIMADLADAFSESDLPYKVDLVDWATTSEPFRRIIEQAHVEIQQPEAPCDQAVARQPPGISGILHR
jgi:predicted nucleotidyltransferase